MAKRSTELIEQMLVDVREQSVAIYVPAAVARRLGRNFGVNPEREMPYHTGMTLETRKDTLIVKPYDANKPGVLPFSPLRPSPKGVRVAHCLVWGKSMQTARCHKQPVTFTFRPGRIEGTLPPPAEREWYEVTDDFPVLWHPARQIALRELALRGPMKLLDIPGWAQNALTPEERLAISRGEYWTK